MPCALTITAVTAHGQPGQPLTSLDVSGTAVECDNVVVQVGCGGPLISQSIPVVQGLWQVTFGDLAGSQCVCDDPNVALRVVASCKADPTCLATRTISPIPCSTCPAIDHLAAEVPTCDAVVATGGWTVTFRAYINGTGVTACLWSFGDGSDPPVQAGPLPQGGVASISHTYPCAGEYEVTLIILSDCEPEYFHSASLHLDLPPCGCPTVNDFTAQAAAGEPCDWTFKAKIGGPFAQCVETYHWNFGDGVTANTQVPEATHTYAADGDYTVTLTMLGGVGQVGGGPCSHAHVIAVSGCADGGGGGGDGGHPCPWWNPFCKGWNLCAGLLAAALLAVLTAGVLAMVAGCTSPVSTPLIVAAVAAAVLGFLLLAVWFAACSRLPGFCDTMKAVLDLISYIIYIQTIVMIIAGILALLGIGISGGCFLGAVASWAYYGTVYFWLSTANGLAGCPPHSPPDFGAAATSG